MIEFLLKFRIEKLHSPHGISWLIVHRKTNVMLVSFCLTSDGWAVKRGTFTAGIRTIEEVPSDYPSLHRL